MPPGEPIGEKDSDAFKEAEQMSRDKYNEFTKLSRAFVRAYPNEFKTFLLARSRDIVARQSFGLPRTPVSAEGGLRPQIDSLPVQGMMSPHLLPTTLQDIATPDPRHGLSPQQQEARRLAPVALNTLAQLGIRLD
jgi:hypothetical protein